MTNIRSVILMLGLVMALGFGQAKAEPALEETIEQTYPIEPTAKVSIHNTDGSIRIYGADIREIKVQAIKRAYNAERLRKILVNVSAQTTEVAIDTQYPPKSKWGLSDRSGTVDYIIILPWTCNISHLTLANGEVLVDGMRGGNVRAELGHGRLFAHNCFTQLHVGVANGGLDVGNDWSEKHIFSVDAEIVNGNARVFLPGDSAFHLRAESANGQVASDFSEKEHRHENDARKIDMTVGGVSENEVRMHAINGNIKIGETNP